MRGIFGAKRTPGEFQIRVTYPPTTTEHHNIAHKIPMNQNFTITEDSVFGSCALSVILEQEEVEVETKAEQQQQEENDEIERSSRRSTAGEDIVDNMNQSHMTFTTAEHTSLENHGVTFQPNDFSNASLVMRRRERVLTKTGQLRRRGDFTATAEAHYDEHDDRGNTLFEAVKDSPTFMSQPIILGSNGRSSSCESLPSFSVSSSLQRTTSTSTNSTTTYLFPQISGMSTSTAASG